ncbi:MAG TPA: hypothetical protein VIM69_14095, partial [Opitutaceae bacterium]
MNLKKFLAAALLVIAPCLNARGSCSDCPDQKHELKFYASASVAGYSPETLKVKMVMTDHKSVPSKNIEVSSPKVLADFIATTPSGKIKIDTEETYQATVTIDTDSHLNGCGSYLWVNFEADVCGWTIESRLQKPDEQWTEWQKSSSCNTSLECIGFLSPSSPQQTQVKIEVRLIKKASDSNGDGNGGGDDSSASPPQLPDDAQSSPPGSNGAPSQITPAGFLFQTEMGSAPGSSGYNTGSVSLSGPLSQSQSLANISNLELRNAFGEGMKWITRPGNTQVTNLEKLADIHSIAGGIEIRFFKKGSFGTELVDGSYPINDGAQPFRTVSLIRINPGSDHLGGIRVGVAGPDGLATWKDTLSTSSDGTSWREVLDNGIEIRNHTSLFDYDFTTAQWRRIDLNEVSRNGVLVSKNQRTYLYQLKRNPYTSVIIDRAQFLTEEVIYDTANTFLVTTWEPDPNYPGRALSVTRPDGSWERYEYYPDVSSDENSAWRGRLKEVLRPWSGQPAPATQSTTMTYAFSRGGVIPVRQVTMRGTIKISETSSNEFIGHSFDSLLLEAGLDPAWIPKFSDVVYEPRSEMASSDESVKSGVSYVYVDAHVATGPNSSVRVDAPWIGRSMGYMDSEGKGSITGYERGWFHISTQDFTANQPPMDPRWGDDLRSTTIKLEDYRYGNFKATKEVAIENKSGIPLRKELWVKVGSGNWALATATTYE